MLLAETAPGTTTRLSRIGGDRQFRRRLMELGLLPGTLLEVVGRAPLGGPLELLVRGCSLSIRREDAASMEVTPAPPKRQRAPQLVVPSDARDDGLAALDRERSTV